jgi:hypothetical protein
MLSTSFVLLASNQTKNVESARQFTLQSIKLSKICTGKESCSPCRHPPNATAELALAHYQGRVKSAWLP